MAPRYPFNNPRLLRTPPNNTSNSNNANPLAEDGSDGRPAASVTPVPSSQLQALDYTQATLNSLASNLQQQSNKPGSSQLGKSAFDWDVFKNRKTALQYLRKHRRGVDTILETEDGTNYEYVHSQVMSAFGNKLNDYIRHNGRFVDSYGNFDFKLMSFVERASPSATSSSHGPASQQSMALKVREPNTPNGHPRYQMRSQWYLINHKQPSGKDKPRSSGSRSKSTPKLSGSPALNPAAEACPSGSPSSGERVKLRRNRHLQRPVIAKSNEISNVAPVRPSEDEFWTGKIKLIRLPKLSRYTLGILVECAYSGYIRTDLASGGIWDVLDVADAYEMVEVIRACCSFLMKNLDRDNCIHFYHVGIKYRHPLQRSAWHKIRANFKHILAENMLNSALYSARVGAPISMLAHDTYAEPGPALQAASNIENDSDYMECMSEGPTLIDPEQMQQIERLATSILALQNRKCLELNTNELASIKFEHFEPLLSHDKLNIDNEESVWHAIRLWCQHDLAKRARLVTDLLPCMRFARFKTGTEFSSLHIWRDPLIMNNRQAQQQLAILDRNHRDFITGNGYIIVRDGYSLPCSVNPRQLRPRVPHSVLLAIGGWQQGQPTTLIESYDVNCNLWFECNRRTLMPLAYHGIEYINGLLYICGGTDGTEILNELFTFDPIRGDCTQKVSMRESRCYVSTGYLDGYLYAMGGHNGSQRMKSVERFDVVNETWSHVQEMSVARSDASACVHQGKIYIAGGLNEQIIESSVEFYNQNDNSWTLITSMITPRTSFSLLLYKSAMLAIGGNNGNERLASVEQFDFETKRWSLHSNMRHRRSTFSAAVMDDSKLIVVGGYNGQTPFSQVEMFDERERAWVPLQKIRYDRSGLKVVVVSDLPNTTEYTYLGHNISGALQDH